MHLVGYIVICSIALAVLKPCCALEGSPTDMKRDDFTFTLKEVMTTGSQHLKRAEFLASTQIRKISEIWVVPSSSVDGAIIKNKVSEGYALYFYRKSKSDLPRN